MMALDGTRLALEAFNVVLNDDVKLGDTAYLKNCAARYVTIVFHSEVEKAVAKIIFDKLTSGASIENASFIRKVWDDRLKRVDKGDLAEVLGNFSQDRKDLFNTSVNDSIVAQYRNFVKARHAAAHGNNDIQISWTEVTKIVEVGETVLDAFEKAIKHVIHPA